MPNTMQKKVLKRYVKLCCIVAAFFSFLFIPTSWASNPDSPPKTKILNQDSAKALLGKHRFSLQWISWRNFGKVTIVNRDGTYIIKGHQIETGVGDMAAARKVMTIDGIITKIGTRTFTFKGSLMTRLSHVNKGEPCWRKGIMKFRFRHGKTHSWRMKEQQNPCAAHIDYVDIYVDRNWQPQRVIKREPTEAEKWGIGVIMNEDTSLPPGMLIFPDSPIPLYDGPDGTQLGTAKADPHQWRVAFSHKEITTEILNKGSDLREIGYETSGVTVYSEKKGFLEIFRQASKKGAWIRSSDLENQGFKFFSWIDFLLTQKEVEFFPRMALTLREGPGAHHGKVASLRNKMVELMPTGNHEESWLEVEVLRYSVHPCVDGKGKISKKWKGWIKFVDDAGFPNVWYPTRGC